jgi:hypothetical protein
MEQRSLPRDTDARLVVSSQQRHALSAAVSFVGLEKEVRMDIWEAANILYVPRRMSMERLHQVMRDAEDKRLDPPSDEEEVEDTGPDCRCGEYCRC